MEAVSAYYEAGRRPASHEFAVVTMEHPAAEATAGPEAVVTAGGQSLEELADELEALIESIRYGSDAA